MCQQRKKERESMDGGKGRGQCCECECHPVIVMMLVLQRGCLSPLCIFFARCCKWIRNVTQTTRQREKREGGRVRRQQSRKSKRRRKRNHIETEPRTPEPSQAKPTNAQSKDEKTMPKFGTNSKPEDSTRACPGVGLTQLCVIFGHLPLPTHSTLDPLSTSPNPANQGWHSDDFPVLQLSVSLCAFWDYARISDDATPAIGRHRSTHWAMCTGY